MEFDLKYLHAIEFDNFLFFATPNLCRLRQNLSAFA
jgi:hypothetical protein